MRPSRLFPGDHTAQNLAVGGILLAAACGACFSSCSARKTYSLPRQHRCCEPVVKCLAKDYPAADATTGLRAGPEAIPRDHRG